MTAGELISKLQKFDPDMRVVTYGNDRKDWYDIYEEVLSVREIDDGEMGDIEFINEYGEHDYKYDYIPKMIKAIVI